jgi:hypothetical protein
VTFHSKTPDEPRTHRQPDDPQVLAQRRRPRRLGVVGVVGLLVGMLGPVDLPRSLSTTPVSGNSKLTETEEDKPSS